MRFRTGWQPSGNAMWTLGRHTVSFGASYSYTQLNTIDQRTGKGTIATADLSAMAAGIGDAGKRIDFYVTIIPAGQCQPVLPREPAGTLMCRTSSR